MGLSREGTDSILIFATMIFLYMANVDGWLNAAIISGLIFLKNWPDN